MVLIDFHNPFNFCSPIDKLDLVPGDRKVGTLKLNHFAWTKVGVSVFELLLLEEALKISACFNFVFVSTTKLSTVLLTGFTFEQLNDLCIVHW